MNKVVLKRTGALEINGVEIECLVALGIKSNGTEHPTITVVFDADEFEIATGTDDFLHNVALPGELVCAVDEALARTVTASDLQGEIQNQMPQGGQL